MPTEPARGGLTQDEARQAVSKTFRFLGRGPHPGLKLPPIPRLCRSARWWSSTDISQANIILGSLGINRQNPDFTPCK